MRPLVLDARLQAAFDFFPPCAYGADIGSDHGKLALALVRENRCGRIAVTDISPVSLGKAEKLFEAFRFSSRADFLLGDGLGVLQARPGAVSICGMGGKTLTEILKRGFAAVDGAALILGPQTELSLVRRVLYDSLSYHITGEKCVSCGGRFYVVMKAEPGKAPLSAMEAELGPVLARQNDTVVKAYYRWRAEVLSVSRSPERIRARKWYEAAYQGRTEENPTV